MAAVGIKAGRRSTKTGQEMGFLHSKALCFQSASSTLFWTGSSFSHEQDKCVNVLAGGLKESQSSRLLFHVAVLKWETSFQLSVVGLATRCWHQCASMEAIQRQFRGVWVKMERAGVGIESANSFSLQYVFSGPKFSGRNCLFGFDGGTEPQVSLRRRSRENPVYTFV